ncbi:MAG: hypothetical protein RJA36_1435 [Pseudomonadota bacterium]|jgi:hypothetical protein
MRTLLVAALLLAAPAAAAPREGGRTGDCCNPSGTVNLLQGGLTLQDLFILAAIDRSLHGRNSDEDPPSPPAGSADRDARGRMSPTAQASRDQAQRQRDARCGCNSLDAGQAGKAGF